MPVRSTPRPCVPPSTGQGPAGQRRDSEPFSSLIFEGEDGLGDWSDAAGAGADAGEDLPVLQGGEASFAAGADSGERPVGVAVGRRQVTALVGDEQQVGLTAEVALVGV